MPEHHKTPQKSLKELEKENKKLKRENFNDEKKANNAHFNVGKNIREVIKKNGGIMPEDLPKPKKSLKQLEKENKNKLYL